MTTLRSSRRLSQVLLPLASLAMLTGCTFSLDADRAGFEVVNRLDVPVDVIYVRGSTLVTVAENLDPGGSLQVNRFVAGGECRSESMVARDQSGAEVATFPGPVCDGARWEIGGPAAS